MRPLSLPRLCALLTVVVSASSIQQPALAQDATPQTKAPSYEGYRLVWSDEFEQDGRPDPKKWTYERGFVRNEELQWYQEENAFCENGFLMIEGRRERVKNPHYEPSSQRWQTSREFAEYTSACLLTRGLASWQYGRFEMRARFKTSPGLWPAFWTLGVENRWPACGEIDIMEYYRGMILANAAWSGGRFQAAWDDSRTPVSELGGEDWDEQFHHWRMDWDEERIVISLDGRVLNEVDLNRTFNARGGRRRRDEVDDRNGQQRDRDDARNDGQGDNPFRQPHYILVNLAIGGTNGGDPSGTEFPTRYEIDYVRVYQKD